MYNSQYDVSRVVMMERMQRTQIYLEPEVSAALGRLARKRGTTKASLIRMAARRFLEQEEAGDVDSILGIIGLVDAGPGRTSEHHDLLLVQHAVSDSAR
jgi:predicted transcriptional regulator